MRWAKMRVMLRNALDVHDGLIMAVKSHGNLGPIMRSRFLSTATIALPIVDRMNVD